MPALSDSAICALVVLAHTLTISHSGQTQLFVKSHVRFSLMVLVQYRLIPDRNQDKSWILPLTLFWTTRISGTPYLKRHPSFCYLGGRPCFLIGGRD